MTDDVVELEHPSRGVPCRVSGCPFLSVDRRREFCAEHYLAWSRGELDLEASDQEPTP